MQSWINAEVCAVLKVLKTRTVIRHLLLHPNATLVKCIMGEKHGINLVQNGSGKSRLAFVSKCLLFSSIKLSSTVLKLDICVLGRAF